MRGRDQGLGTRDQKTVNSAQWTVSSGHLAKLPLRLPFVLVCSRRSWPLHRRASPWEKIPVPPLHAFNPQEPKRIELRTGLCCFCKRITSCLLSAVRC